ncbi:MAG: class I mannose-6-phosphate isomerase [Sedimentisphaerales bacterium]|nr:class I mannose-6-phosphate isomerase [Sedimentisphaerales bacterium]
MRSICALKFEPRLKERIWGSDNLKAFGKAVPVGVAIGESWELCDLEGDFSIVASGPWAGETLRTVLQESGQDFGFTADQCKQPFGLFVKLLDSNDVLSVQVHPDEQAAGRWPGAAEKSECWYVMSAKPGAEIYYGLQSGVDRAAMKKALEAGTVDELLVRHKVKKGDFFFVSAGTVHALGAGVIVAEIQIPSDTTYRLFDWNRVDSAGKSRQLHIEEGLDSINFQADGSCTPPTDISKISDQATALRDAAERLGKAKLLADCEYFAVVSVNDTEVGKHKLADNGPMVMICVEGGGSVTVDDDGDFIKTDFVKGDTLLLPGGVGRTVDITHSGELLLACLGGGSEKD